MPCNYYNCYVAKRGRSALYLIEIVIISVLYILNSKFVENIEIGVEMFGSDFIPEIYWKLLFFDNNNLQ